MPNLDYGIANAVVFAIAFATVAFITPKLIRRLETKKLVAPDANKASRPMVPVLGGAAIVLGFVLAILVSLQLRSADLNNIAMLAALNAIVLIAFLGILDDLLDIPDKYRVVLPLFAALPLMVTKAGTSAMNFIFFSIDLNLGIYDLPLLGPVTLNLYPLLLVPIGVIASSNLVNLLAGFNGLEAGVGAIVGLTLFLSSILLFMQGWPGSLEAGFLSIALLGVCLAFLRFNWFPAKIFPGNGTTYLIGATVVAAVVIGNFERVGVIALLPQIAEFILKARSGFKAENFGKPDKEGRLHYDGPVYSLTHILMKKFSPKEPQLVLMLLGIQAFCGILALLSVVAQFYVH